MIGIHQPPKELFFCEAKSMESDMARPTILRLKKSKMAARKIQPSWVWM